MKQYALSDIQHFKAPYLEHGFKEEIFELTDFYYNAETSASSARFEVIKHYTTANEPSFYLDSLAAMRLMYQVGIITICLEKAVDINEERPFPLFSRGTTLNCKRFIREKTIELRSRLVRKRDVKEGTYYRYGVDICNGAFMGECKLMLHPYSFYDWN